jgi:hypothetical protein
MKKFLSSVFVCLVLIFILSSESPSASLSEAFLLCSVKILVLGCLYFYLQARGLTYSK